MAISLASIRRSTAIQAPRIVVYGVHGIGKSTFGACAPAPIFLPTEDGLGALDAPAFPLAKSFAEVLEALGSLYSEPHDFKTLVVDSLDWLEPLIWAHTCELGGKKSIEDFGYGKGYLEAVTHWRAYLDGLNALRNDRGMTIIQIAHTAIKRFDSPETEPYDRYEIKLHQRAAGLVQEWADCVLFANYRVMTTATDVGFNAKVRRAIGGGERLLHTTERPAYLAKNRYSLPETLPLTWQAFSDAMTTAVSASRPATAA